MINKKGILSLNNYLFERYGFNLFCLFLFLVPLKLSIAYACFFPLSISGLAYLSASGKLQEIFSRLPKFSAYWIFLIISLLASASFGLDPLKSYRKLLELTFYSSSILVFYYLFKFGSRRPILFLIAGQAIASSYSILEYLDPKTFKQVFIGAVTESGQIALTIFLAFACLVEVVQEKAKRAKIIMLSLGLILIFIALFLNMKRGPILGVGIAGLFLFTSYRPKMLFAFFPALVLPLTFVSSLRTRILDSIDHFMISGGRYDIWEIGVELAGRFPLGIGYANSRHLQDYSNTIPSNLKHFHNNYLNILVEGGMLSLLIILTFFLSLVYFAYQAWRQQKGSGVQDILLLASIAAICSWMVAGFVEYSFGDSEVMLIVYVLVSYLLLQLSSAQKKIVNRNSECPLENTTKR